MDRITFTVSENETEIRLDRLIPLHFENITRSYAAKLSENGYITAAGKSVSKNDTFKDGTEIAVSVPEPVPVKAVAQDIPIDVLYEDSDLLIVNKPKGMVVHPAAGNPDNTLVNALLFRCGDSLSGINGEIRPGIVHRLDKDTGGLLIAAKNDETHRALSEMIKAHNFTREYEAIVLGNIKSESGEINKPVGRSKTDRKKMCVRPDGRTARTEYSVIARYGQFTHLRLKLFTGRTHQIRVHMSYIGYPVLGDSVYGKADKLCKGQCLYAKHLSFIHPKTGQIIDIESDLPDWFLSVIDKIGRK